MIGPYERELNFFESKKDSLIDFDESQNWAYK